MVPKVLLVLKAILAQLDLQVHKVFKVLLELKAMLVLVLRLKELLLR